MTATPRFEVLGYAPDGRVVFRTSDGRIVAIGTKTLENARFGDGFQRLVPDRAFWGAQQGSLRRAATAIFAAAEGKTYRGKIPRAPRRVVPGRKAGDALPRDLALEREMFYRQLSVATREAWRRSGLSAEKIGAKLGRPKNWPGRLCSGQKGLGNIDSLLEFSWAIGARLVIRFEWTDRPVQFEPITPPGRESAATQGPGQRKPVP